MHRPPVVNDTGVLDALKVLGGAVESLHEKIRGAVGAILLVPTFRGAGERGALLAQRAAVRVDVNDIVRLQLCQRVYGHFRIRFVDGCKVRHVPGVATHSTYRCGHRFAGAAELVLIAEWGEDERVALRFVAVASADNLRGHIRAHGT